jgi:hypothetical protein
MNLIDNGNVDLKTLLDWVDVESSTTTQQRRNASVILNRLTGTADLKTLVDKTKKETSEFRQKVFETNPGFDFVGLLMRQDRQWTFSQTVATLPSATGKLFVLQKLGDNVRAVQVGSVSDSKITLSSGINNVLQCSPVFFVN